MSTETAAILEEAANVIRRNGWHQGSFYRQTMGDIEQSMRATDCPVCAYGAINVAAHGRPTPLGDGRGENAMTAFERYIATITGRWPQSGANWNDEPGRTAEQVIAALESAAQAEREASS